MPEIHRRTVLPAAAGVASSRGRETATTYSTSDHDLMSQVQAGSGAAFGALYDRYRVRAYGVARSVCHDTGCSEEAVQEAFLSIWRARESYRVERGAVAGWLLTVVHHRAVDVTRRSDRHAARRADDVRLATHPAEDDVVADVTGRADASRLVGLLEQIPAAQREVITLAFYGQLTHTEIATQLNVPPGTIKGRMRLGLNRLRIELDRLEAA